MDLAYDDVRRILIENDPEGLQREKDMLQRIYGDLMFNPIEKCVLDYYYNKKCCVYDTIPLETEQLENWDSIESCLEITKDSEILLQITSNNIVHCCIGCPGFKPDVVSTIADMKEGNLKPCEQCIRIFKTNEKSGFILYFADNKSYQFTRKSIKIPLKTDLELQLFLDLRRNGDLF